MILLGFEGDEVANVIILLAKLHIYRLRVQSSKPSHVAFLTELKNYYETIRYIVLSNMKYRVFDETWRKWKI